MELRRQGPTFTPSLTRRKSTFANSLPAGFHISLLRRCRSRTSCVSGVRLGSHDDNERSVLLIVDGTDAYWAMDDPFEHHRYVCLAILSACREALEELDESEIRSMMLSLPKLDVRRLLAEAHSIKTSIQASQKRAERNEDLY
jgi:hypothetical protein